MVLRLRLIAILISKPLQTLRVTLEIRDLVISSCQHGVAGHGLTAISVLVTVGVQWWSRQPLMSIVSGTGLYVFGLQGLGL